MNRTYRTQSYILVLLGIYYGLCSLSALFKPTVWITVAGISLTGTPEIGLLFGVIGAYMGAVSYAAFIASRIKTERSSLIRIILLANILDAFITARAIYQEVLPLTPGLCFLGVIALCTGALLVMLRTPPN